jgi:hypothetical protein
VISFSKVGASIMSYTQEVRAQLEDSWQQRSPERFRL